MDYAQPTDAFKISQGLQQVATSVDNQLVFLTGNRNTTWLLMTFSQGQANYISNNDDRSALAENVAGLLALWRRDGKTIPIHEDASAMLLTTGDLRDDLRKAIRLTGDGGWDQTQGTDEQKRGLISSVLHRAGALLKDNDLA